MLFHTTITQLKSPKKHLPLQEKAGSSKESGNLKKNKEMLVYFFNIKKYLFLTFQVQFVQRIPASLQRKSGIKKNKIIFFY
jgi:hypothetical protein